MTKSNDLLDAVDALTLPYESKVFQSPDDGEAYVTRITHTPRLEHLRESIVGGIGSHGGGSGEDRLPFDAGALALYDDIESRVSTWFVKLTGKPVYLHPETTIRQWYVAFDNAWRAGEVTDENRAAYARMISGWVTQIDGKFDPRKRIELTVTIREPVLVPVVRHRTNVQGYSDPVTVTHPDGTPVLRLKLHPKTMKPILRDVETRPATCPECGHRDAYDPKTGDKVLALLVEFKDESTATVDNATVTCRSCEHVWEGGTGLRAVSWEIEQEQDALNALHRGRTAWRMAIPDVIGAHGAGIEFAVNGDARPRSDEAGERRSA